MISSEAFGKALGILLNEIYPSQSPEDAARTRTHLLSAAAQLLDSPFDAAAGESTSDFSLNFKDFSIRLRKMLARNSSLLLGLGNSSDLYSVLGYVEESLLLICTLFRCEVTVSPNNRYFLPRVRPAESSEPTKHLFMLLRTALPALLVHQYHIINVEKLTNYESDRCSTTDDPNHKDRLSKIFAVFSKSLKIVLAVLKEEGKQANQDATGIDAIDYNGRTPLSYALERGVGLTALFAPRLDRWNSLDDARSMAPCECLTPLGEAFIAEVLTLLLKEGCASPTKDVYWTPGQPRRERFAGREPSGATLLPHSSGAVTNQFELADEEGHEVQKDEFVEWCGSQKIESFPSKEFASNLGISPLMYLYLLSGQVSAVLAVETPTKMECGSSTNSLHASISALLATISNVLITFGANVGETRGVSIDVARKLAMPTFRPLLVDLAGDGVNSDHPAFQEVGQCQSVGFGSEQPAEPLLISALRLIAIFETLLQNASPGVFPCSALLDTLVHKSDLTKPYLVHAGRNQNVVSTRFRQQHPIGHNALLVAVNACLTTDHVKSLLNQLERNAHAPEAGPFSSAEIEKHARQNILHVALHRLAIILKSISGTHFSSSLRASLEKCCEIVRWVVIDFTEMCDDDDQGPLPSLYRLFGPRFFDDEGPDGLTPLAIVAELLFLLSDNPLQLKTTCFSIDSPSLSLGTPEQDNDDEARTSNDSNSLTQFFTTVFMKLIDLHGANVNFINPHTGDSLLHTAIKKNNQIVFELLTGDHNPREHGDSDLSGRRKVDSRWLDLMTEDRNGMTVLNIAVARRDLNSARQLLQRESLQIRSSQALESTAQCDLNQLDDNPLRVAQLPTFDLHKLYPSSRTRLQNANIKRVRDDSRLAEAGSFSPLLTACYLNDLDMVRLLLDKSRNVEEYGLILSADPSKSGFVDESSSEAFLGMGVVKRKNRSLTTALRVALIPDHDDSIRRSENYDRMRFEIARYLLECGADPNESSVQNEMHELRGGNPVRLRAPLLHELSQKGLFSELATVLRLSQTRIDVNTKSIYSESNQYGMTALHCVVTEAGTQHTAQKQIACVLEKAISFITSSLLAKNAESIAIASDHRHQILARLIACAGLLIYYGADVNSIDGEELSVLERAVVSMETPTTEKGSGSSQNDDSSVEDYGRDLLNELRVKCEAPHSFLRFFEFVLNVRDECCSCAGAATKGIHQASVGFRDRQSNSMCLLSLALMSAGATTNINRRVAPFTNSSILPQGTRPLPTIASRPLMTPRPRHATLSAQRLISSSILIISIEKEAFLIVEALLGYRSVSAPTTLDLNAADAETGFTALHTAIWRRKVSAENKRDIDVEFCSILQNVNGKEANEQCAPGESDEMLRVMQMLLAASPSLESRCQRLDTHKKDSEGRTTIHLASALGHYTIVELLLAKMDAEHSDNVSTTLLDHISVNCKTTLLHIAVEKRSLNMARAFLVRGAPIDVKRHSDGHTPISLASSKLFSVFNSNNVNTQTPLTKKANCGASSSQMLGRGGTAIQAHSNRQNPTSEYAYFSQFRDIKTRFSAEDCEEITYYLSIIQYIRAAFSKGSFCEAKSKSLAACAIPVAYALLSPLYTTHTVRCTHRINPNPVDRQQNELENDDLSVKFVVDLVRCLTRFEPVDGTISHELLHHMSFILAFKCVNENQTGLSAFDIPVIVDDLVVPLVRSLPGRKSGTFSNWSPLHAVAYALRFSTPQTLGAESRAVDTQIPEPLIESPFDSLNRLIDALIEHDTKNIPQTREIRPPAGHPSPIHIIAESLIHFITECSQEENRASEKYRLSLSSMCDDSANISENVYTRTKDIYSLALNRITESEALSLWGGVDATTPLGTTASQIACSAHVRGVGELADSMLRKISQKSFLLPLLQRSFLRTLFSVGQFEGKAREARHPAAFPAANPNFSDEHGRTLLFLACADGNENVALFLLREAGADPNFQPICRAPTSRPMPNVSHSQTSTRKLIPNDGCVRDPLRPKMLTPLHAAVERASYSIVNELLFHGADPNTPSTDGRQPINIAAEANNTRICQILLGETNETHSQHRTANPNASYYNGITPLQAVSKYHNIEMAKLLIEKGACVNMQPNPNWVIQNPKRADPRTTQEPSQTCSSRQRTGNANLLGKSTLLACKDATKDEKSPAANQASVPSRLPELPTIQSGTSPLHYACSPCAVDKAGPRQPLNFSLGLIALLLNSGADATATDELGRTPLHLLAGMCRWENKHTRGYRRDHVIDDEQHEHLSENSPSPRILALLLAASEIITRAKPTIDAEDCHGRTPLMSCLLVGRRYDGYNEFSYSRLHSKIQPHLVPQDVHQWRNDDEEERDDENDTFLIQKDLDAATLQKIGGLPPACSLFHRDQLRIFVTNSSGLSFAKLLLINGANPNTSTLEGCLPLTLAVERHREGTTLEEKSKAASTFSNTPNEATVLGHRCPAGWSEDDQLILALLASGADSALPDRAADKRGPGACALQIAIQRCQRYASHRENLRRGGGGEWQTLLLSELDFFDFGISRTRAWREALLNSASRETQLYSDNLVDCDDCNESKSLRDPCGLPPSFAPRSLLAIIEQRETSVRDSKAVSDSFYPIFFAPFLKKFFFTYALSGGLLLRLLVENGPIAGREGHTSPALLTAIRLSGSFDHDVAGSDEDDESEGRTTWDCEETLVRSLILSVAASICGYLMSIGFEIGKDLPTKDAIEKAPLFLSDLIKSEIGL